MKNLQRKWLNVSDRDGSAFDPIRLQDRRRDSNVVAGVIGSGPNMRSNAVHDIKVFGVGGAGNNAINRMISEGVRGVTFVAVNCDAQDLEQSRADERIIIGERSTKRLGAGADPRLGEKAAIESLSAIEAAVADADMVFVTAGMGGGTGSGAGPIVARAARAAGALTVGVVTTPFAFEQGVRMRVARTAAENMYQNVDSLVVISNNKLVELVPRSQPIAEAFRMADEMLLNGVRGVTDLITNCGFINVDFADVRKIMYDSGTAMLGVGSAAGADRAESALRAALKESAVGNTGRECHRNTRKHHRWPGPRHPRGKPDRRFGASDLRRRRRHRIRRGYRRGCPRQALGHRNRHRVRSDAFPRIRRRRTPATSLGTARSGFDPPRV